MEGAVDALLVIIPGGGQRATAEGPECRAGRPSPVWGPQRSNG